MDKTVAIDSHAFFRIGKIIEAFVDNSLQDISLRGYYLGGSRGRGAFTPESDYDVTFIYAGNSDNLRDYITFKDPEFNIEFFGISIDAFLDKIIGFDPHLWETMLAYDLGSDVVRAHVIRSLDSEAYFRLIYRLSSAMATASPRLLDSMELHTPAVPNKSQFNDIRRLKMCLDYAELAELLFLYVNRPMDELREELLHNCRFQFREQLGDRQLAFAAARERLNELMTEPLLADERRKELYTVLENFKEEAKNIYKCAGGILLQAMERHAEAEKKISFRFDPLNPAPFSLDEELSSDFTKNINRLR